MSSNHDKIFKAFEAPPDQPEPTGTPTITADDLSAVETRINRHIAESIERLDAKITSAINAATETKSTSAGTEPAPTNESEE